MSRFISVKKQATRNVYTATGAPEHDVTSIPSTDFIQYIKDDAVLNSNLRQLQDGIFENYPRIDDSNNDKAEEYNKQLDKTRFGKKLKNQFAALWHNGNMFFEIDVIGNKLIGFYEIDAESMTAVENDKGEIIEYKQKLGPNPELIMSKEKILHIKAPSLRTGVIGEALLTPLTYSLARKKKAENYLSGMLDNLNPLLFMNLKDDDDGQAKHLQNQLRLKRDFDDPLKLITLLEDEKIGRVDTGTTSNFDKVQQYIDAQNNEIIRVVQIPPIIAGTVDNSNRSNSEIQERAVFGRTAGAWQNFFMNELNNEFREKVGWKDFTFEFPQTDDRKQEAALVRAAKFKELGYNPEAVHETLVRAGIKIESEFIEEPLETGMPKDINDMPSRQPRDKGGIPQNEEQRQQDVKNGTKKVAQ